MTTSPTAVAGSPGGPASRVRDGELLRLHAGVAARPAADGALLLADRLHGTRFAALTDGQRQAVELLGQAAWTEAELLGPACQRDGEMGAIWLLDLLARLRADGWLEVTLVRGGRELVTIVPQGPARPQRGEPAAMVLSRFAVLHREGGQLVLESPRADATVLLRDPVVLSLLGELGTPGPPADRLEGQHCDDAQAVRRVLWGHHFVVPADGEEDTEFELCQWSPHELWFHQVCRMGRHDLPYGGTYWAAQRFPAPPPARTEARGPAVELPRPDLTSLEDSDPPLARVMEARQSIRAQDNSRPITVSQLGEFLYRCARVRGPRPDGVQELTARPYPSGGSIYELELYPVVTQVTGLAAGMYHYDPFGHRLTAVPGSTAGAARLLAMATQVAVMPAAPQVLIVISARFGRLLWKYQTMAYAVIMKNVGALYSVMYLVATAMGLAPCAMGGGSAADFELATGADPLAESSVGEFVIGSKPAAGQPVGLPKYGVPLIGN